MHMCIVGGREGGGVDTTELFLQEVTHPPSHSRDKLCQISEDES